MTAALATVAVFGLMTGGGFIVLGAIAAVFAVIGLILTCIVDLSIRNGHRNVERILNSLQ